MASAKPERLRAILRALKTSGERMWWRRMWLKYLPRESVRQDAREGGSAKIVRKEWKASPLQKKIEVAPALFGMLPFDVQPRVAARGLPVASMRLRRAARVVDLTPATVPDLQRIIASFTSASVRRRGLGLTAKQRCRTRCRSCGRRKYPISLMP